MNKFALALIPLLVLSMTVTQNSSLKAQGPQKVTEIEGITEFQLDNGVQLLLFPDASKPQVTVNVTVLVGSRHEGYGETGMAHLLEHMLFKGTPTHEDIPKLLGDRGVLNMNGTTWYDRTNYYETLPAEDGNLEFMLHLESDRLINSYIDGNELAKEMTVVRNEFERGENDPTRILMQRMLSSAFEWHNYGKSTIGNRTDIERVPVDRLRAFYKKYYRPDNIMVIVAGKFEEEDTLKLVQKYFGTLENPKAELPQTYTEEPVQDGERIVSLNRVGEVQTVGVGYHIPAASHEDYAPLQVLSSILGVEPAGRLYKGMVETEIADTVSTMVLGGHDPGMILNFAEVSKAGDLEKARATLIGEIEKIATDGVEESEVKRIIQRMVKTRDRQLANSAQLAISLSDWRAYGDWRLYFLHRDRMEKVTPADVQRVAKTYCVESNRTIGLFHPTEEPVRARIPSAPKLKGLLADYKGRAKIAAGEGFDPSPENIDARTETGTFASGVKYAMLPKKTRGERITVSGILKYGTAESLKGKVEACKMFPSMLMRGTTSLDFQEFKDRMDETQSTITIGGGPGAVSINLSTKRENFSDAMDLLKDALRNPSWNEQRFIEMQREQKSRLEQMKGDPQALAANAFQRKLAPYDAGDPRYVLTVPESIEAKMGVKVSDCKAVYDEFLSGQHGQFAFVGDFDRELAISKMNEILSDWTTEQPYSRIETPAQAGLPGERLVINTPDKANSVFIAGMHVEVRDDTEGYEALQIGNYILGGGSLSSRLADRVRKEEGLSYSVGSILRGSSKDVRSSMMMYAISNPENTEKVVTTINEEIKLMLESGVTEEELAKAKESFIKKRRGGRANDGTLASTLLQNLNNDRTMEFHSAADARIELLTKEVVDETLRKFLDPNRLIIATAGDFSKVGDGEEMPMESKDQK